MSTVPQLETLREEIEAKKKFIASLPDCRGNADVFFRAKHQKILGGKEEELELLLEAQRRADVVREHAELHPPYTEECPICLEDVRVVSLDCMKYFACCGNGLCKECADTARAGGGSAVLPKCPMCRAKIPKGDVKGKRYIREQTEQQAKNGRSWAQYDTAMTFLREGDESPVDKPEAMKWLQLAVEQRYAPAVALLADLYRGDHDGGNFVEYSLPKARALAKEAADMGVPLAQACLGQIYNMGEGGPVDNAQAIFYYTLAYRQNHQQAVYQLGRLFIEVEGESKSPYRAKYYFQESAEMGDKQACLYLAVTLREISWAQYDYGKMDIPGHSCIPRSLYWARKAAEGVSESEAAKAKEMITGRRAEERVCQLP